MIYRDTRHDTRLREHGDENKISNDKEMILDDMEMIFDDMEMTWQPGFFAACSGRHGIS